MAGLVVLPLLLTACGGDDSGDGSTGTGDSSPSGDGGGKIGVILPDAATSPRWENNDRPLLDKAIKAAGYEAIIQNASKDVTQVRLALRLDDQRGRQRPDDRQPRLRQRRGL